MKRPILTLLFLIFSFVAQSLLAREPGPGEAACVFDGAGNCQLTWNLPEVRIGSTFRVERYDVVQDRWTIQEDVISPTSVSKHVAAPGSLYRVVGCSRKGQSCVGSTVYWIPVFADSAAEIPETVRVSDGILLVPKHLELQSQLLDYNVYLLVKALEMVELTAMPEMTKPVSRHDITTLADLIHVNVYPNYANRQATLLGME